MKETFQLIWLGAKYFVPTCVFIGLFLWLGQISPVALSIVFVFFAFIAICFVIGCLVSPPCD